MPNKTTTKIEQAQDSVNLPLSHDELVQLRDLAYKAHLYNSECNFDNDNEIIYGLVEMRDNSTVDQVDATIALLNKIAYLSHTMYILWERLKSIEKSI